MRHLLITKKREGGVGGVGVVSNISHKTRGRSETTIERYKGLVNKFSKEREIKFFKKKML